MGAIVAPGSRLPWWAAAAVIDLIGTWLAHPVPGRVLHSEHVAFDADHMIERCRLFLIVAPGEAVLTAGTALTNAPRTLLTLVSGVCALVTIIALWAPYFAGSDRLVKRTVETTTDPIFAARMAVNGLLVVVAGLIALAVGNEPVIAHSHGHGSVTVSLLRFGGPLLYLLSQTSYLWTVDGTPSWLRLVGIVALVAASGVALGLPPVASLGLLATLLVILVVSVLHDRGERRANGSRLGEDARGDAGGGSEC